MDEEMASKPSRAESLSLVQPKFTLTNELQTFSPIKQHQTASIAFVFKKRIQTYMF